MCQALKNSNQLTDSAKLLLVYGKHLFPFADRYDKSNRHRVIEPIFYRFQRNCGDFADLLNRLNPPDNYWDYWEKIEAKPKTELVKSACREFVKHKYIYSDSNRDTVHMLIDKGHWVERFRDGTYSKLRFRWIDDCEFEIEFIESTNSVMSQVSKRGDRYRYQIINKNEKYYLVSVEAVGTGEYHLTYLFL
jgi:hypothetical protein